jgi:hypothetical protein
MVCFFLRSVLPQRPPSSVQFHAYPPCALSKTKTSPTEKTLSLCQGRTIKSAVPPCFAGSPALLFGIHAMQYPRQLTRVLRRRILSTLCLSSAPSAVHLPTRFTPDSQRRGLSVMASSTLSPLHRFFPLKNVCFSITHSPRFVNGASAFFVMINFIFPIVKRVTRMV